MCAFLIIAVEMKGEVPSLQNLTGEVSILFELSPPRQGKGESLCSPPTTPKSSAHSDIQDQGMPPISLPPPSSSS